MPKTRIVKEYDTKEEVVAEAAPYQAPTWFRDEEEYCIKITLDPKYADFRILYKTKGQVCGLQLES